MEESLFCARCARTRQGHWAFIDVQHSERLVSYRGHFYYRSGSTAMEVTGTALEQMLLQRKGSTWDAELVPGVTVEELSEQAFALYKRKAVANGRQNRSFLEETRETILDNLRLTRDGMLTRAAVLLFHPEPDRFFFGATLRLGYFQTLADLIYQDDFKGPLFVQLDTFMDTLYLKYLRAYITYEGIQRIDEYLFPREAVREAILNSLIHKDYAQSISIQVKVFESEMHIYNPGRLPDGWTVDDLMRKHSSKPFNPLIADAFYSAGEIEHWGRGIDKIVNLCSAAHLAPPQFEYKGGMGLFLDATAKLAALQKKLDLKSQTAALNQNLQGEQRGGPNSGGPETAPQSGQKSGQESGQKSGQKSRQKTTQQQILKLFEKHPRMTTNELAEKTGFSRSGIMKHISQMQSNGLLKRVGADKNGHWEVLH